MVPKSFISIILVLAMVTMACSVTLNVPQTAMKTIPTQTESINVPVPSSTGTTELTLIFGAGNLKLNPGAAGALVDGTAKYNVEEIKPVITTNGNQVKISTGKEEDKRLPNFGSNLVNEWDLKLGDTPIQLILKAGAYQGNLDLGGLSLESLDVTDGATQNEVDFSAPNKVGMSMLRYQTGASQVTLKNLANANCSNLVFKSGAGDYTLDFSGTLQQDASVSIESGLSSLTIRVPEGVPAEVNFSGGLSNISTSGSWQKSGSQYVQNGSGPKLTITIQMGAGNVKLENP